MVERHPRQFDLVKAAFWLVATIMAIYALTLLAALTGCFLNEAHAACAEGRLTELLATLLATAVAFAGGLMRQAPPAPPPPPNPPEED